MDLLHGANKPNRAVFLLCIFTIHDSDDSGTQSYEEESKHLLLHMSEFINEVKVMGGAGALSVFCQSYLK